MEDEMYEKIDGIEFLKRYKNNEFKGNNKIYTTNTNESIEEILGSFMNFYVKVPGVYRQLHVYRKVKGQNEIDVRVLDTEDILTKDFYIKNKKTKYEEIKEKLEEILSIIKEEKI